MKLDLESELRKENEDPETWAKAYLAGLTRKEKEEGAAIRIDSLCLSRIIYHPCGRIAI